MAKEQALERIQMYDDLLLCIDNYMATAKWQKLWRGTHFWVSIFFIIASMVVTTFTSNIAGWSSIFWILFSVALTASGLIDGLISLLFGNKEIRALQEVYEEVSDAKRFLSSSVNN